MRNLVAENYPSRSRAGRIDKTALKTKKSQRNVSIVPDKTGQHLSKEATGHFSQMGHGMSHHVLCVSVNFLTRAYEGVRNMLCKSERCTVGRRNTCVFLRCLMSVTDTVSLCSFFEDGDHSQGCVPRLVVDSLFCFIVFFYSLAFAVLQMMRAVYKTCVA